MTIITRFAPSPTGLIHIGNVRTALLCYLIAKKAGGKFMLRLDDTDTIRSKESYAQAIQDDLKWLGLNWDMMARQSERSHRYNDIKEKLISDGRLYPCYETSEELDMKRKILINRGLPPIYDRSALNLTKEKISEFDKQGIKPHWRFKLDENARISWDDQIKGNITFEAKNLSDPVLIRANGSPTYMLPSAIDDMDFGITHVVRGEDHVSNTAIQIQLFEAMGSHIPSFAHNALMKSKEGKISKRDGGYDIQSIRTDNIEVMTVNSYLARLGTSNPIEPVINMNKLIDSFDITIFTNNSAIYEYTEIQKLNSKILHMLSYDMVKDRDEMKNIDEYFYNEVKSNLNKLIDIIEWQQICKSKLTPVIEDIDFIKQTITLLPTGIWDENTWGIWVEKIKALTGRKGKDLFMPLRLALTARANGPELKVLLPLIGKDRVVARLSGQTA
jgi:glutamyl-tRNA synthetase